MKFGIVWLGLLIFFLGFGAAWLSLYWPKKKPARKKKTTRKSPWMTQHQLEVLKSIAKHGRRGVPMWHTEINLSTIRSLAKRGYIDTRARGRIITTRAGKRRLNQPWPAEQPVGDQKNRAGSGDAVMPAVRSGGAAAVSSPDSLTGATE